MSRGGDRSTLHRWRPTRGHVAAAALLAAAIVPPAWLAEGPLLCPFRALSGVPCPACGLTRSLVSLAHGDVAGSFYFHPLGVLVGIVLAGVVLVELLPWLARKLGRGSMRPRLAATGPAGHLLKGRTLGVGAVVVLLVWLARLPLYVLGYWVY